MKNIFITTLLFLTVVFCSAQEKYVPSQENLTNREWIPGCQIRYVYPLGDIQYAGWRRMGADQQKPERGGVPKTGRRILSLQIQCGRVGTHRQGCRDEIHLFHLPPSRRFSMFDTETIGLQHCQSNSFQTRCHQELAEACQNTDLNYSSTIPISTGTDRIITRGGARDGTRDVLLPARGKII